MRCPNCGAEIGTSNTCEYCGSTITSEMKKEQEILNKSGCPKCGSTNIKFTRENHGEVNGKNSKKIVHKTVGVCNDCGYTWYLDVVEPKKRKTWLWVLGWIFIFPVPLTILMLRKKDMKPAVKYGIIAAAWVLYLIIGFGRNSSNNRPSTDNTAIVAEQSKETEKEEQAKPEEQAQPAEDNKQDEASADNSEENESEEAENTEDAGNTEDADNDGEDTSEDADNGEEETDSDEADASERVFDPQDVSDETIESIETYGDYLIMYEMIIDDYYSNLEDTLKGTILYDEATFKQMRDELDEEFAKQEEEYGEMKDMKIVGKESLVQFLKDYRDSLQEVVNTYDETLEGFK